MAHRYVAAASRSAIHQEFSLKSAIGEDDSHDLEVSSWVNVQKDLHLFGLGDVVDNVVHCVIESLNVNHASWELFASH